MRLIPRYSIERCAELLALDSLACARLYGIAKGFRNGIPELPQPKMDKRSLPQSEERRRAVSAKLKAHWAAKRAKAAHA